MKKQCHGSPANLRDSRDLFHGNARDLEPFSATRMTCVTQYPFEREGNINPYQMIRLNTILQLSHDGAFDSICHPCVRHLRIQFVVGK